MATKTLNNIRTRHTRDTSANWTKYDPVLLSGEIVIVDTASGEVRYKVGDGVKKYSELPFSDETYDSKVVHKTGDETIAGIKTFSNDIKCGSSSIGTNGYIEGTWLKTTAASNAKGDFATISNGWIYKRTPSQVLGDIGGMSSTAVQYYTVTNPALTSSNGVCTWTVNHNMNKKVVFNIIEVATKEDVLATTLVTSDNILTVKFGSTSNIAAGKYRITVIGSEVSA